MHQYAHCGRSHGVDFGPALCRKDPMSTISPRNHLTLPREAAVAERLDIEWTVRPGDEHDGQQSHA